MRALLLLAAAGLLVAVRPAPQPSPPPGERLFTEKCGMCHRKGGMGTGLLSRRMDAKVAMLESRNDLTGDTIEAAIRTGIGNMPRISRAEVSDAQLRAISAYLTKRKPK